MAELEVTASVPVAAPPERVWEVVSDTSRYAEWVEGTAEVTRSDGPARFGSTYDEVNPILGPWKARTRWTVEELDPPRRQVHRGEGIPIASDFRVIMELTPVGDDACEFAITLRGSSSLGPLGAAMTRLLEGRTAADNRRTAENLAELVAREPG